MVTKKIPFGPQQQSGQEELGGASPIAMNVVVDGKGVVRRRPAITALGDHDLGGPVTGLYADLRGNIFAYVDRDDSARAAIYRIAADGSVAVDVSEGLELVSGRRPTFAETEAMVVIADGLNTLKWTFAASVMEHLGGDPPKASHVIANTLRLLCNNVEDVLGQVNYTGPALGDATAGNETWSGGEAGSFVGEARPDPVVALHENTNEVFLFGKSSLQVYAPDAVFVYGNVATRETGCVAPYSVVKSEQVFAWLDQERNFVIGDGRTSKTISDDIQADLDALGTFDDCFGFRVSTGPVDCIAWSFPTDGRTFVYQVGAGWSQWASWSEQGWAPLAITASCVDPNGGRVLVGTRDGKVGVMDFASETDLGAPVVAVVESGFIDHGTGRLKHCQALRVAFRRGQFATAESVLVSWRDDLGEWSEPLECELGDLGDTSPELVFRSLGVYRRRQWRVQFSGSGALVLVSVEEEIRVLAQ